MWIAKGWTYLSMWVKLQLFYALWWSILGERPEASSHCSGSEAGWERQWVIFRQNPSPPSTGRTLRSPASCQRPHCSSVTMSTRYPGRLLWQRDSFIQWFAVMQLWTSKAVLWVKMCVSVHVWVRWLPELSQAILINPETITKFTWVQYILASWTFSSIYNTSD